jgi:hypothetical protein
MIPGRAMASAGGSRISGGSDRPLSLEKKPHLSGRASLGGSLPEDWRRSLGIEQWSRGSDLVTVTNHSHGRQALGIGRASVYRVLEVVG